MSSFASDVQKFADETRRRQQRVFAGAVQESFRSIRDGSPITGAPGQPVVTGGMRDSWRIIVEGHRVLIVTNHPGAPAIEYATKKGRALVTHSGRGGSHSLVLTKLGFQNIVDTVVGNEGGYSAIGVAEGGASPYRGRQLYIRHARRRRRKHS